MPHTNNESTYNDSLEFQDIYLIDSELLRGTVGTVQDFPKSLEQQNKKSFRAAIVEVTSDSKTDSEQDVLFIVKVLVNFGSRFLADTDEQLSKEQDFLYNPPRTDDEEKLVLLEAKATFCVDFLSASEFDLSDSDFEDFCRTTALGYVWPFWREHVFNLCSRANVPKFDIPVNP